VFSQYKYRLGVGCIVCKHVWFLLSNDEKVSEEIQLRWAKDVLLEHYDIREEKNHGQGF